MLTYNVDSEIKLALPRPEIDGPKLFALIQASPNLGDFLPWVKLTKVAADEENFLRQCNEHWAKGRSLNLVIHYRNQVAARTSHTH